MRALPLACGLVGLIVAQPLQAGSGLQPQPFLSSSSATAAAEMPNAADEQFKRLVARWKAETPRVPSLAAIYDAEAARAPKLVARAGEMDLGAGHFGAFGSMAPSGLSTARPSRAPVSTNRLTSAFGPRIHPILGGVRAHSGVDLAAAAGTPVRATADGVVARAGWAGGYGLLVAISHSSAMTTRYGHMSRLAVSPGDRVRKNDVIGYVGSTGRSTGPHLHYEVLVNGRAVNPMSYMR